MAIRQPLSTGTSESCIIFYNGGHNHDGTSSALINTAKYSIYDFTTDFTGTDLRQSVQSENFRKFKNVIADIVKTDVLTTAGITLSPNQVRAENISAGAVTATSLAANIVLVNNIISSNNYVTGVSGWAINSNGTAEFANTSIRGTIAANSVSTPGLDIDSNGNLTANSFTLYGNGAIVTSSGKFSVDESGNLFSNSATISGTVTASSVSTPGLDIDSNGNLQANNFALYSNGQISTPGVVISPTGSITANTFALYANGQITNGAFSVSSSGVLSATGATISGTVTASQVSTPGVDIDSAGNLTAPNFALYANGAIATSSGNFGVDTNGVLSATGATISGNVTASGGTIGGYNINATSLYSATISLQSGVIVVNASNLSGFAQLGGGESRFNKVGFSNPSVSGWDTNFYPYTDQIGNLGINTPSFVFRWNNINHVGSINNPSDERIKTSITPLPSMLQLINSLNPVSYLKKVAYTESMIPLPDNGKRAGARRHFGLIAQEVRSAMNANGFNVNEYSGWGMTDKDDPESEQMLMYLEFIGILLKGVQELSQKVSALENAI